MTPHLSSPQSHPETYIFGTSVGPTLMTEMAEVKETLNPKSAGLEMCVPHDRHGEEPSQA